MKKDVKAKGKSMKQMNNVLSTLISHKNETRMSPRTARMKCVIDGSSSSTPSSMYDFMVESPQLHSSKSVDINARRISKRVNKGCTSKGIGAKSTNNKKINVIKDKESSESKELSQHVPSVSRRMQKICTAKIISAKSTKQKRKLDEDKESSVTSKSSFPAHPFSKVVQKQCTTKDIGTKVANNLKRKLVNIKETSVSSRLSQQSAVTQKGAKCKLEKFNENVNSSETTMAMGKVRKCVANKVVNESKYQKKLTALKAITPCNLEDEISAIMVNSQKIISRKRVSEMMTDNSVSSEKSRSLDSNGWLEFFSPAFLGPQMNDSDKSDSAMTSLKLDDISAIVVGSQKNISQKRVAQMTAHNSVSSKKSRSHFSNCLVDSFNPAFLGPQMENSDKSDSAICVSPRQTIPRFSTLKSITPEITSSVTHKKDMKIKKKKIIEGKETSTPIEAKPQKSCTTIKEKIPKFSPVLRVDTPTSDFCSMDSFMTPKVTPAKKVIKKDADSPAFTLEEYADKTEFDLNKSMEKSYRISRKKYESGTDAVSKMEQWAEKVNTELENVENFELRVDNHV